MITVGVDEVGRGSWAGPVVAAAVLLHRPVKGLKDSKLLNKTGRQLLAEQILNNGVAGLGWVPPAQIDEIGLTAAIRLAMQSAVNEIGDNFDEIIVDGNLNFLSNNLKARAIIKADATVPAVSAASIVAKVARDKYMTEIAVRFSNYGFEKHVGYGTKLHIEMLKLHGICVQHRLSYKPIQALMVVRDV